MGHHLTRLSGPKLYRLEERLASYLKNLGIAYSPILLSGEVANPGLYNVPNLTPVVTQTVTYTAAGTPVADLYTGVPL
jgi:protein involved in polysaccharide export with SLBB domain